VQLDEMPIVRHYWTTDGEWTWLAVANGSGFIARNAGGAEGIFQNSFALSTLSTAIASEVVDGIIEAGIASAVGPATECQGDIVVGDTIAGRWEQHSFSVY
jgi:hypothetical protein